MTCWMMFLERVKKMLKVSNEDAIQILEDVEKETGHNLNLMKIIIDTEGENLIKRLKKKSKEKKEVMAYA